MFLQTWPAVNKYISHTELSSTPHAGCTVAVLSFLLPSDLQLVKLTSVEQRGNLIDSCSGYVNSRKSLLLNCLWGQLQTVFALIQYFFKVETVSKATRINSLLHFIILLFIYLFTCGIIFVPFNVNANTHLFFLLTCVCEYKVPMVVHL